MVKLEPNNIGRLYHDTLYTRFLTFAETYTPEFPAIPVINHWLTMFYTGDNTIHILVNIASNNSITAHCIIQVQEAFNQRVCYCHQILDDKRSGGFIDEAVEYVDKLRLETNSICSVINIPKNAKVYEKKYGYQITRTTMIKYET